MTKLEKTLLEFIDYAALQLTIADSSDEEEEDQVMDELEENIAIFSSFRYSFRGNVPKNLYWFEEILPNLDERRFKMLLRCTQPQFNIILALIEDHPVFKGINSEKQFTVQFQLALTLYRLGSNGDGATLMKIASLFGVGDGGTIDKVTARVFESILSLEDGFIRWPTAEERKQLVIDTFDELPHCVVYCDGTSIPLMERPIFDPTAYYSKDKEYAIKMQGVCDYKLYLRQITIGYPGSVHDSRIYKNCRLYTHPRDYFSENEYLAADGGYGLSTTVITPFRRNSNVLTSNRRAAFNKYFCSYRVRIEHVFGILKEMFPCLYNLAIRIRDEASHKKACTWIRVCCILYNILRPHLADEDLTAYLSNISREDEENDDDDDDDLDEDEEAQCKRVALVQIIEDQ